MLKNKNSKKIKGIDLCNRTACQTDKGVYMFNKTMDAFYCARCAELINDGCKDESSYPLCVKDKDRFQKHLDRIKAFNETN